MVMTQNMLDIMIVLWAILFNIAIKTVIIYQAFRKTEKTGYRSK